MIQIQTMEMADLRMGWSLGEPPGDQPEGRPVLYQKHWMSEEQCQTG